MNGSVVTVKFTKQLICMLQISHCPCKWVAANASKHSHPCVQTYIPTHASKLPAFPSAHSLAIWLMTVILPTPGQPRTRTVLGTSLLWSLSKSCDSWIHSLDSMRFCSSSTSRYPSISGSAVSANLSSRRSTNISFNVSSWHASSPIDCWAGILNSL